MSTLKIQRLESKIKKLEKELESREKSSELKAKFRKEITAFRSSAEKVLNEMVVYMSRERLVSLAAAGLLKDVAYGHRTKFEAKQWIDKKIDKIHEFEGTHLEFLEWLEIDEAEKVYERIEKDIAEMSNDFAVKMFFLEREELSND